MGTDDQTPDEGTSRRTFLRRMAAVGFVGAVPVVSSFGLLSCEHPFPPGGGSNGHKPW